MSARRQRGDLEAREATRSKRKRITHEPAQEPRMGAKANQDELNRALFEAVWFHDGKRLVEVLREGADPNARDAKGNTPIMYAAMPYPGYVANGRGRPKAVCHIEGDPLFERLKSCNHICGILLKFGADPLLRDRKNHNALFIADTWDLHFAQVLMSGFALMRNSCGQDGEGGQGSGDR